MGPQGKLQGQRRRAPTPLIKPVTSGSNPWEHEPRRLHRHHSPFPQPGFLSSSPESLHGSSLTQRDLHSGKVWAKGRILSLGGSSNGDPRGDDILSPEQTSASTLQPHVPALCSPTAPTSTPLSSPTAVGARPASFWGLSTHQPCPRQTPAGEREREAQAWGGPCRGTGPSCGGCLAHLGQVTA